jgi:pimeloyl-ACP methyl ester carboxylesterase
MVPPAGVAPRVATEDTVVDGVKISAGSPVLVAFTAANYDPTHWTEPFRLDIRRPPRRNMTFGVGAHICLGMGLPRPDPLRAAPRPRLASQSAARPGPLAGHGTERVGFPGADPASGALGRPLGRPAMVAIDPGLVLVHGAQHRSVCWSPLVRALERQAPGLRVLAVDLPGRDKRPGDGDTASIAQLVTAVIDQIDQAGMERVVLVGHSMAGLLMPGIAAALGGDRLARLVFVSCSVPPHGRSVVDTLSGPMRLLALRTARRGTVSMPVPAALVTTLFCNGMTTEQKRFVRRQVCREGMGITAEPVDHSGLPRDIPRTWVLLLRDRCLPPRQQRRFIDHLGGVDEVVELDTCHDAMVSEPDALATILVSGAGPARHVRGRRWDPWAGRGPVRR